MRKISEIIVHCAATPEGKHFTVADIDAWHKKRGFKCIGYHFVIYLDGSVHKDVPLRRSVLTVWGIMPIQSAFATLVAARPMAKLLKTLAPRLKSSRSSGLSPNFAAVFRTQAFMVTTNLPIRLVLRLTSRLRGYANFSSFIVDSALLVPLAEASAVGFFRRCPADEYDGNHIVVALAP